MMQGRRFLTGMAAAAALSILVLLPSCTDPFEYYDPPGDSPDPIYTQITKVPEFSIFAQGLELVPELVRIIDASGLYTAFIPTDSAFHAYFSKRGINSIDQIPVDELTMLVNYHLLYDLRFLYDFWYEQAFNPRNTYAPEDTRYLTRCKAPPYTVKDKLGRELLVRTYNKYMNVYVREMLARAESGKGNYLEDYKLVYGKDANEYNINGTTIVTDSSLVDQNAENGALHAIVEVIEPPRRIDEIISESEGSQLFKQILDKIAYLSPSGLVTTQGDSLYDISFGSSQSVLVPLASEEALYTVFIPPDEVLAPLLGTIEVGFGGAFDSIPNSTLSLLFLNHITNGSYWDQDLDQGINTIATPDKTAEVKGMITSGLPASNGMVYYINDVLVPDQLSSVAGPILLNQDFYLFAKVLERTGTLRSLSNLEDETNLKTILAVPNEAFAEAGITYEPSRNRFKRYNKTMTSTELKHLFEYHILRGAYDAADLEDRYYETENYMWVESRNGEFFGNETGNILTISETFDWGTNGYVYRVDKILVPPSKTLKSLLESNEEYASFAQALRDHFLLDQFSVTVSNGTYHTFFVPANAAMDQFVPDSSYSLYDMLHYHMVETFEQPLFTFGTENGSYETMLEGSMIEVEIQGTNMTINQDAQVIGTSNVLGISGVIQQVDKILSPPSSK
ncbi:MAG: fasciclin domain-containing protein [Bacteroidales bacterium]